MNFKEWFNADDHDLYNYHVESIEMAWDYQQAIIDRLMLEHCPDEMTAAQVTRWEAHQRSVNQP